MNKPTGMPPLAINISGSAERQWIPPSRINGYVCAPLHNIYFTPAHHLVTGRLWPHSRYNSRGGGYGVRPRGLPLSNHLLVCGLFVAKLLIMCGRCQKCGAQRMFAISGGRWSAFSRWFMDYIYFKPAAVSAKTIKHEMNRVHLFISY